MTLILANAAVGASAYTVDGVGAKGFSTIQEAIDASEAGDEIIILNGTYSENLVIDKSLALKGEGGAVVNGSGSSSPLVTITSDNVTLEGLTFAGCKNESFDSGAVLVLADGCRLLNSTISASTGNGLCLRDSRDHLAAGNLICDNR
ncbi:MAG TPA: cell surface protein, partial [Methanothrix sp.]|nr:cell surface protein [Methanothrix sp.]HQA63335.1 cell surface protein [Methanothrix sp.]